MLRDGIGVCEESNGNRKIYANWCQYFNLLVLELSGVSLIISQCREKIIKSLKCEHLEKREKVISVWKIIYWQVYLILVYVLEDIRRNEIEIRNVWLLIVFL